MNKAWLFTALNFSFELSHSFLGNLYKANQKIPKIVFILPWEQFNEPSLQLSSEYNIMP